MAAIDEILRRGRVTVEVDGVEFVCHRPSAMLAIEAFGAGCLMVVNEGTSEQRVEFDEAKVGGQYDVIRKYLQVAMISPQLGDADSAEDDTISWRSLGDFAPRIYNQLMGSTVEDVADFPERSEDQEE